MPNLRLKVLMAVGSLIQLVTPHVQGEGRGAHSNLHCLPLSHHSLMTSCPNLCLRVCANLQAPELVVYAVL